MTHADWSRKLKAVVAAEMCTWSGADCAAWSLCFEFLFFYELFLWLFLSVLCLYFSLFYYLGGCNVLLIRKGGSNASTSCLTTIKDEQQQASVLLTTRDQLVKCCSHSLCCHGDEVAEGVFTQRCLNRCWSLEKKCCLFDIEEDT